MTTNRPTLPIWLAAAAIAALALGVRLLHLWWSSHGPFFGEPVVDALTYHNLARELADGGPLSDRLLWQAPFYPLTLAGIYKLVGPSVAVARVVGAVVGTATAVVTWHLARRLLGPRSGLVAGAGVALHGGLVAFDTELLATRWAALWLTTAAALLVTLRDKPRATTAFALGVVAALALLTRTVLLPPILVGLGWTLWPWRRQPRALMSTALGLVLVLVPFGAVMQQHTGHTGLWPPSGAVNLYLGNSDDLDTSLTIRPGLMWEELVAEPVHATGVNDPWVSAGWFEQQLRGRITSDPGGLLAGLIAKTTHLLSSRELPRNTDILLLRPWSPPLAALLWSAGPWGFPSGLLIPLAIAGLVVARRRLPAAVVVLLAVYAVGLVLVFTSARYRAPMWPLAIVAATAGLQALRHAVASRRWRTVGAFAGVVLLTGLAGTVPGPFAQERVDIAAEMWHGVGFNQLRRGELDGAEASFRQALSTRDDYPEAWNRLGVVLARRGEYEASIPCFERAAALAPDYPDPTGNLDEAHAHAARVRFEVGHRLQQADDDAGAAAAFRDVLVHRPDWPEAQARLAWILATTDDDSLRDPTTAVMLARRALAEHGSEHPWLREVLDTALAAAAIDTTRSR